MTVPRQEIQSADELNAIIQEIVQQFQNATYQEDFRAFTPRLAEIHAEFFSSQSDPFGNAWAPLQPSTIARKGHDRILYETGRLEASLSEQGHPDHIEDLFDSGFTYGTSVPYSIFHQEGTGRMPQRAHVGFTEEVLGEMVDHLADAAVEKLKPQGA